MAKTSVLLLAVLALLLANVTASIYQTITATTLEITHENPAAAAEQCREQIQGRRQQQMLRVCERYLTESSRSLQRRVAAADEGSWREEFPRCCEQLEKVSEQCRCEAVKMVVERQRQQGQELQGEEVQEMLKTAMSLPALCRMGPQRCEIPSTFGALI